ncbi:MAG: hypothetical protein PF692_08515 [Kiritimatiellae bacterium]|jgi:hypothetical protein|nr:hypothetical protein [Kiritimatiellia bacterium]
MSKIEKIIREIDNLRDFYFKTANLRSKIKKSATTHKMEVPKTNSALIVAEDIEPFDK